MTQDPVALMRMVETTADELGDVLCYPDHKKLGTRANLRARQLVRQLHDEATRLRLTLDPS